MTQINLWVDVSDTGKTEGQGWVYCKGHADRGERLLVPEGEAVLAKVPGRPLDPPEHYCMDCKKRYNLIDIAGENFHEKEGTRKGKKATYFIYLLPQEQSAFAERFPKHSLTPVGAK